MPKRCVRSARYWIEKKERIDSGEVDVDSHATELCIDAFEAMMSGPQDRQWKKVVLQTVESGCKSSPEFLKECTKLVVRSMKRGLEGYTSRSITSLLCWTSLVLRHLDVEKQKAAKDLLIQGIDQILGRAWDLGLEKQKCWTAARDEVRKLLLNDSTLADASEEAVGDTFLPFLASCIIEIRIRDKGLSEETKKKLLSVYSAQVVGSVKPTRPGTIECFEEFIPLITPVEFSEIIHPCILRMCKRSPETVMPALYSFCKHTELDLSPFLGDLLPPVILQIRHKDEIQRKLGLSVLSALLLRIHNVDSFLELAKSMLDLLSGKTKEGKIKNWIERSSIADAIGALTSSSLLRDQENDTPQCLIIDLFTLYMMDEVHEDVLVHSLVTLGRILYASKNPFVQGVVTILSKLLKEKRALLQKQAISCLIYSLFGGGDFQTDEAFTRKANGLSITPLIQDIGQILEQAIAKPNQFRAEGTGSLLLLVVCNHYNSSVKVPDKAFGLEAGLLCESSLQKLLPADLTFTVYLIGWLLSTGNIATMDISNRILVLLTLHPCHMISGKALALLKRFAYQASFRRSYLQNLWERMRCECRLPVVDHSTDEIALRTNGSLVLKSVLHAIPDSSCSNAEAMEVREFVLCILLVLMPSVRREHGQSWQLTWRRLCNSSAALSFPNPFIKEQANELLSEIVSETNLKEGNSNLCAIGANAIGILFQMSGEDLWPALRSTAESLVQTREHDGLGQKEIEVWLSPPNFSTTMQLHSEMNESEVHVSSKKEDLRPSIRDARAEKGIRTGAKQGKKDPRALALQAQREEEEKIRHHVSKVRSSLVRGLIVVDAIARQARQQAFAHLQFFSDLVCPLLPSPVIGDVALDTVRDLCACVLPDSLARLNFFTSLALRETCITPVCHGDPSSCSEVARSVVAMAHCCKEQGHLLPQTYTFFFPIIRYTLSSPKYSALHEDALLLLASHTSAGLLIPRSQAILVCYHVMQTMPALTDQLQAVLLSLCEGLEEQELDSALEGLLSEHSRVRAAAIGALGHVPCFSGRYVERSQHVASRLWLAIHDVDGKNAECAETLWDLYPYGLGPEFGDELIQYTQHKNLSVREAAADAVAAAVHEHPNAAASTLLKLFSFYPPDEDVLEDNRWEQKNGVALAIKALSDELTSSDLPLVFNFLISKGLADPDERVRTDMVAAGVEVIDQVGADHSTMLVPLFESYLNVKKISEMPEDQYDLVREGVIVFLGRVAKHLPSSDVKVKEILQRLLKALLTPSESVQRAVSECLPGLVPAIQSDSNETQVVIEGILDQLFVSPTYGARRGAAFGLAGLVKGLGISALKQYNIGNALKEASEAKKDPQKREGALFAYECLCDKLGRMFEPYVIHILPVLLSCFSDSSASVREATELAARAVMRNLSAQGVRLVMPSLLKGLDDPAWRTQVGSVQMLGAMAFCAPRQLSACLPTVVPKLSEVLGSSHPKVQGAAKTALEQIGSVIQNPEVQELVPVIILAFDSPAKHNQVCLETILETSFVNTVDAPSLALLVPVVNRGIRDRSTESKKKAAKIIGKMSSLTSDAKDLIPYVPLILPELQKIVVDPNPEIRAIAANSLGLLLRGLGEENFTEIIPWLLETMTSETNSVERSGAAQGLSEILAVLDTNRVDELLPSLLMAGRMKGPAAREGHLVLCRFLPMTMKENFARHLPLALPVVIGCLSDDHESVREAAFSTARVFIDLYAQSSFPMLLPAIEEGMFNQNWKIRQSSVELLGEFLFKVSGISAKLLATEGVVGSRGATEAEAAKVKHVVGEERMHQVLSRLYLSRSDPALTVRTAALSVWKSLVPNTPRTLVEVLAPLMSSSITLLASGVEDLSLMAGRCLGELVRKLGDRILPKVVPILKESMRSPIASTRCGVCAGLTEILEATTKSQLSTYLPELLPTVELALCDPDESVRSAGGMAFGVLVKSGGRVAIDAIVPALIAQLHDTEGDDRTLEGLKQVLSVCPQLLSDILPKLVYTPMDAFRAESLGALAEVASSDLERHLGTIVPPLIEAAGGKDENVSSASQDAVNHIASVLEGDGVDMIVRELVSKADQAGENTSVCRVIEHVFKGPSRQAWEQHAPSLLQMLVPLLNDADSSCVQAAWLALNSIISGFPKEKTGSLVRPLKNSLTSTSDRMLSIRGPDASLTISGLCIPKGMSPFITVFLQGILQTGSTELRQQSAEGLQQAIALTSQEALKPFVVQVAGPLIRTMSDRSALQVKGTILKALGVLINKAGMGLKPFVPQLQTTFVKCLQDGSSDVRNQAAQNLGPLMKLSTRVDPLVTELSAQVGSTGISGVKLASLRALCSIFDFAGQNVSPQVLSVAGEAITGTLCTTDDDAMRAAAAAALGAFSVYCSELEVDRIVNWGLVSGVARGSIPWQERLGHVQGLAACLRRAPSRFCAPDIEKSKLDNVLKGLAFALGDEKIAIREVAAHGSQRFLCSQIEHDPGCASSSLSSLLPGLASLLSGAEPEGCVAGCTCFRMVADAAQMAGVDLLPVHFPSIVPPLLLLSGGKGEVRTASEHALRSVLRLSKDDVDYALKHVQMLDRGTRSSLTEGTLRRLARKNPELEEESYEW